ncbi:ADP-ribosylglycohydrolase family protein [Saccharopolyspora cebuensis]|uniref:ADP-ribosylglycohydrolase family protein n=1 Tax=Saccharopolyspora cebuensis TaxID=418759 RepID=A0ABV4CME8_9PSEU
MTVPRPSANTTAQARGTLLGAALGDALGARFEGEDVVGGPSLVAHDRAAEPLRYTDDTAQTIVLARHLVQRRDRAPVDEDALATDLARAWQAEPWRGYGAGSRQVLELVAAGVPWPEATRACFGGHGSYGNGAAMRVAALALIATSLTHAAQLADRTAKVTHAHQHGREGAELQACAVFLALHSDPVRPLDRDHYLDELSRALPSTSWHGRIDQIRAMPPTASPSYAASLLGNDATAIRSVPMALHSFLRYPDHPAEAIRYAIRAGGDTDTIASMAGALAGARTGIHGLPVTWLERLENADRIRALADRLAPRIPRTR